MSLSSENTSIIKIVIHFLPGNTSYSCNYDINKSFRELKNYLKEKQITNDDMYYFEMNDHVLVDDMTLRDSGVVNDSNLNALKNDNIKIKLKFKDDKGNVQIMQNIVLKSDFKILTSDENKVVNVCIIY